MELPTFASWPIIKQIIFILSSILNLIFEGLQSVGIINVALSVVIFSFIIQLFLLPFGIRSRVKNDKANKKREELNKLALKYQDKMENEEALKEYKSKEKSIEENGKSRKGTGCLFAFLQFFLIFCALTIIILPKTKFFFP